MFFAGTLEEGISTALQQSKQVVCFVTDGEEESQQWETEFLTEDTVKTHLQTHAVTLRLQAGSTEAGYLEALFPVPRKPTVVIIENGQLKEYIAAGTTREEFLRRVNRTLAGSSAQAPQSAPQQVTTAGESNSPDQESLASPQVQALLVERAARLEADKKAKEQAAKAEAKKRAEERRAAEQGEDAAESSKIKAAESKYANLLRKKKQDERDERQRILRRIEDDKRERREREAQERQARLLLAAAEDDGASVKPQHIEEIPLPARSFGTHCSLQIRLLDGSTIRNRFPTDAKLGKEVREWIDENRTDSDEPYTFRIVLTPLPNKAVEPAEEADSLGDLGLSPSATIVLVPRVRVATAFQQTGGVLFRAWSGLYALLSMIIAFPLTFVGAGRSHPDETRQGVAMDNLNGQDSTARGQDQRIRGFQNPDDRRRDQQLYNGNSLNFEPRNDEDNQEEH
ncbi:hypothetical protein PFICI_02271 [Pestalotiopsis fici W106-1]|uniref:UBX domain-containing protein 2 n=1 Tax=Pestalotiopsis fici (strain W106-1 / CGMCC3.15140) TaxID=1229662 RepID=W3XGD3_PESFW|nr:uncharacterized protein PFICI_02271 [Pestalotiopsis fici W106-1]ETS84246.1 hypothetical protein PFICI_02271 [Pestalotiopsis fici W106-1]